MDMETLLQLSETSLKMGFGALIAVFSGWLVLRRQHAQQLSPGNRRLEILENVSANVGTVSHIFAKYSTLVLESIQFGEQWPVARKLELDVVNTELVTEFKKLAEAEAKLLIKHPMFTGLQRDLVSMGYWPAFFVNKIEVNFNGEPVMVADTFIGISEDPNIQFHFVPQQSGKLSVTIHDNEGGEFHQETDVQVL